MTNARTAAGPAAAPGSLLARFFGVISAPGETFHTVAAHPRWFGMLALTTLIVAVFTALPMTTPEGQQAALDQQVSQMEAFGATVSDEQYEQMRRRMGFGLYFAAAGILVGSPIIVLIISAILFAVFNVAMGGNASFKQVVAVVVHAGVISALSAIFTGPLNYLRGAVGSATNLGVLLPMIDDKSFVGRLLGMTDLFIIWWLVVLAIGLAVLFRRRTKPVAVTLLGVYAVIVLCVAAVMSGFGGGN